MTKIRRINFYGGPGSGKSTTAAAVFGILKKKSVDNNFSVELCTEYVKSWAWEGKTVKDFDQFYICAKQMRREEIPLRNGVDLIVSDSPLLMQCAYAKKSGLSYWEDLISIVEEFEKMYPSLHIFLERGDRSYVAKGRYETLEEAKKMDENIKALLSLHAPRFECISHADADKIVETILLSQ